MPKNGDKYVHTSVQRK